MMRPRTPVGGRHPTALLALATVVAAAGCSDGGRPPGGVGDPCDDVSDCEEGLFCGPDRLCYDPGGGDGDGDADSEARSRSPRRWS